MQPTGQVELSIFLTGLPKLDTTSQTDPFVVLFGKSQGQVLELGRTEVIDDNCNPGGFVQKIIVPYYFEWPQPLTFKAYDCDSKKHLDNLAKQQLIGEAETVELAAILCAPSQVWEADLMLHGKNRGHIKVVAEQLAASSLAVKFIFACTKLEKKDLFSSDPFLVISKATESGDWAPFWKSEVVKKSLKPQFKLAEVPMMKFGDADRPLKITCYDFDEGSPPDFMGELQTTCRELEEASRNNTSLAFTNPNKKGSKATKSRGFLHVQQWAVYEAPSFISFLQKGLRIHLSIAIDFTGSNGAPSDPRSLHYMGNPDQPNEYIQAIRSVGSILAPYDPAQRFAVHGFGGKINGNVSHNFLLAPGDGTVEGVAGVEAAYVQALSSVQLSGPTLFAQFIANRASVARSRGPGTYEVLLVLTDGVLMDAAQTIKSIVDGSETPLSIIIVGVGSADMSQMSVLDADTAPLKSGSKTMVRDIVQFVSYREHASSPQGLAAQTLAELPSQVLDYHKYASKVGIPFM
ncbi:Copine [Carpediemonas membranifera]|uniref:Copine n=1 Tax=Carpediemonas membranifera TaxID=201153 RepID=A0A8J6AR08_9EUKA|nr:Copine [Carpediemonas membranifera]|eukprot:KAG9391693.1 Copine [Carpediemonas membranifera]